MAFMIRSVFLVILIVDIHAQVCKKYSWPSDPPAYEVFVPAPPGQRPRCAKPGDTFCESLDLYPQSLIKFLLEECSINFDSFFKSELPHGYNYPKAKPNNTIGYHYKKAERPLTYPEVPHTFVPATVYGPPPNRPSQRRFLVEPPHSYPQPPNHFVHESSVAAHFNLFYSNQPLIPAGSEQKLWNGYYGANDIPTSPHTAQENPFLPYVNENGNRQKRQSDSEYTSICPTRSVYITPRAAMNSEGNWKFIVNFEGKNEQFAQVVRSEICTRDTCDGLCSLPSGYTSRCQQQYVQKRLVALEGSGNRLYNDIFWFPHGCMCQVILNY